MTENQSANTNFLDLRGVACPMNFVKTRLKLDKMSTGEILEVWLDDGEPIESVTSSVLSEGHLIECSVKVESYHSLRIRKSD